MGDPDALSLCIVVDLIESNLDLNLGLMPMNILNVFDVKPPLTYTYLGCTKTVEGVACN